jgi:CheY-like chemotaxis protein
MEKPAILVVEDNPVNQLVVKALSDKFGFKVTPARSGYEALSLIRDRQDPFDAILMDLNMPVMDGIECTKAIRQLETERGARTPIIGLSAHSAESCRKQCVAEGMDDYLEKPISPERFKNMLLRWTSKPTSQEAC